MSRVFQWVIIICLLAVASGAGYAWYSTQAAARMNATKNSNLTNGLVGLWSFDGADVSGTTAYDRSGQGNNGTLTNSPRAIRGKLGQALNFDGADDYVSVPTSGIFDVTTQATYSAWVKLVALPGTANGYFIIRKWVAAIEDKSIAVLQSGKPIFYLHGAFGGTYLSGNTVLVPGEWYHIVGTYDGTTAKIYVNGVVDNSKSASGNVSDSTGVVSIGRSLDGANPAFMNGAIDDVRIYSRTLSENEIRDLYQLGASDKVNAADAQTDPLEKGLTGYWKLDENTGTTAADASGNGNTGTLTNGPTWTTGRIGSGVNFSASNQHITVPSSSAFNVETTVTYAAWIKLSSTATGGQIVRKAVPGVEDKHLNFNNSTDKAQFFVYPAMGSGLVTASTLAVGTWYHVTGTYDGATARIYLNGKLENSVAATGNIADSSGDLVIGNDTTYNGPNPFPGTIDEVRIYNRAFTATEVASLYNTGK